MKNQIIKLLFVVFLALNMPINPLFAQKNYKEAVASANAKIAAKDYENAIPFLSKAIEFKPKIAENYYLKGLCNYFISKEKEAIPFYDEAIKRDAKKWQYFRRRADVLYNAKEYEKSLSDYLKAVELEPTKKSDTLFQYLADNYRMLEKFQLSVDNYDKAISINNKALKLYFDRAYMHAKLKNKEKGCADYKTAFEGDATKYAVAKTEAYSLLACEWAKPQKDNSPVRISRVEVLPFTGTIITSKGLYYDKLELSPEKGGGFVTSAVFAYNDEVKFKFLKPKGFELDNNKVDAGIGFEIFEGEKFLGGQENVYGKSNLLDAETLKSLSISLNFSKPLVFDKIYTLKAKFFDNLSNKVLLLEMPFTLADSTSKTNSINSSTNTIAMGVNTSASGEVEIKKIDFLVANKPVKTLKANQKPNQKSTEKTSVFLSEIKNISNYASVRYSFVNRKTAERTFLSNANPLIASTIAGKKGFNLLLETPQTSGNYILWIEVKDKKDRNKIWCVSYPLVIE